MPACQSAGAKSAFEQKRTCLLGCPAQTGRVPVPSSCKAHLSKTNDVVRVHLKVIIHLQAQLQPVVSSKCEKCMYGYVAADHPVKMQTNSCLRGLGSALFSRLPLERASLRQRQTTFFASHNNSQSRSRCWCKLKASHQHHH